MTTVLEAIPVVPLEAHDYDHAARLLEQAVRAGTQDANAFYLLALCYKRLGRIADARHMLTKIAAPDANVLLQRGVLAFLDHDYTQAADHFQQALERSPQSYAAAYNLLLTR